MIFQSSEQVVHDKLNLARLVRRLEKSITSEDWSADGLPPQATWIKARGTLQKLKYARKLLKNVEINDDLNNSDAFQKYAALRTSLDRLEHIILEVDRRLAPKPVRPAPILLTIPLPVSTVRPEPVTVPSINLTKTSVENASPVPATTEAGPVAAEDLLLSPSDNDIVRYTGSINPSNTLLPPNLPASTLQSSSTSTPAILQNSAALQEELSAQLAQMASQLKRNAVHFSDSLEKDKAAVLETQEKLERNYDVMKRERLRVRDHHSKGWGTTWIVILSLAVALIGFILTFFVIRIT
ncbi:hypothetical protein AcW1_008666 [Taiwanofungus camphoratus]|nr:hypothetical protein AcW1_008666 [Antrodia cinnamomea]